LIGRSSPDFDQARAVYNAMIDRRPGAIARCADISDVIACVRFAAEMHLDLAIRGGGHNAGGLGDLGNYDRLAQVKTKYDPHNLFHVNQNIPPSGPAGRDVS
jgi:FAD/FMN-containing dehydrogenase